MTKLDELIQELCPQGVERKRLGDIGVIIRGNGLQKKDFTESGVGCIHYGQIYTYYGTCAYKTKSFVSPELAEKLQKVNTGDLVIAVTSENVEDVGKCVVWLGDEQIVTGAHAAIFKHNQDPKYVAYWFQTNDFFTQKKRIAKGTKVIDLTPQKLEEVTMPVPPLPVQREIVQILDNFTELTEEITEKLTAELTARKKQYEYYRDTLLTFGVHRGGTFDKRVWTATIADICKHIQSGGTPKAGNSDYYGGTIPWLRTQEVNWNEIYDTNVKITEQGLKNSSAKMIPENCVIVAMYGATAGKVAINKIPLTTNQACCNLEIDETKALYRYVFHWLSKEYLSLKALGQGPQSNINAQTVKQYPIPIPPLEVQQRIVNVLDNFDAICSDLNIGLPAEIEARKKQYEYYRDMLLTFAAADDIILTDRQAD